ncbi:hypothetical protein RSSE_c3017 [Ralstonia solanacearum]|nr:hypothetical protein RSSE_c3017 [Ralstonia solanacearum]
MRIAANSLRDKTRVKIDHPDLPDAIKQVAAEAVLAIWRASRRPRRWNSQPCGPKHATKGHDAQEFIDACREMKVTPHFAQNTSGRPARVTPSRSKSASASSKSELRDGASLSPCMGST